MIREILIFQFSHLLLKRIIRIQELGKMLMSYKKTQVVNHRFQMCRHRAAIFCQLLGSPERNHRSPHLAASANHPVGGGVKRDGLKSGGETAGEGGISDIHSYQFFFYEYIWTFVRVKFVCTNIFGHSLVSVLDFKT